METITERRRVGKVSMPAGTYIVGDPCYSISDERWMEWLERANYENSDILEAELDGYKCLGLGTMYGDGMYRDNEGHVYGVDAGLIGLVPIALCPDHDPHLRVVKFNTDFTCYRGKSGRLRFGSIVIQTGD